jgi:hypothetical protein
VKAFVLKCEAFVKITRLLKDIFRKKRLFKNISRKMEAVV